MKTPELKDIMNQRNLASHVVIFMFSLVVTIFFLLSGKYGKNPNDIIYLFIILFLQIEVFIFFGSLLFTKMNFDRSPGIVTRVVSVRFIYFLVICLIVSMTLYLLIKTTESLLENQPLSNVIPDFIDNQFNSWFKSTVSGLSLGAVIFIFLLWQTSLRREQKLREENLIFLNETLKNQVNPHFLFNSLNTLSSLIVTQPDTAQQFIARLASIYRYILENSRKDRVSLKSELTFITDYFELHKIRDEGKMVLNINAPEAERYEIIPVSLQILIENATKHNMATRENPLNITIHIENRYVVVENNLQRMSTQLKSTRIGLKNLAERINLATGKVLVVEETIDSFIVKVPLLS
jgi:two-component system LytT family sensor kinase